MKRTLSLLLSALLVLSAAGLCGCNATDYKNAVALMEAGSFDGAREIFRALGDYKDSASLADSCSFSLAKSALEAGRYDEAAEAFLALGDYPGAKAGYDDARYQKAKKLMTDGSYAEAEALFTELGGYLLSKDLAQDCRDRMLETTVLGRWISDSFDASGLIAASLEGFADFVDIDEIVAPYAEKLAITMRAEFLPDGTAVITPDRESYTTFFNASRELTREAMLIYFEEVYRYQLAMSGFTLEDLYAELGVKDIRSAILQIEGLDVNDILDQQFPEELLDLVFEASEEAYPFSVSDGDILISDDEGDTVFGYDPDTDTLTLDGTALIEMLGIGDVGLTYLFHREK